MTNPLGAPIAIDDKTLQILEECFLMGCSDGEACLRADISQSTLYNYQTKNPDYLERKKLLKKNPTYRARQSVYTALEKDPELSLKYLERKEKNEFSLKTIIDEVSTFTLKQPIYSTDYKEYLRLKHGTKSEDTHIGLVGNESDSNGETTAD
jgi:hypothetical protein